jgi:hypothetical protein
MMPERERSWLVAGPLSGRLNVTDEDGRPRLRRAGAQGGPGRTGAETANARLILHRTAVFEILTDSGTRRLGDLDDTPIRAWAVETGLGQSHSGEVRARLADRRAKGLGLLAGATGMTMIAVQLTPQGALITGTGAGGVRDVGIELHGTHGWPFIPASALKGVASAYARDSGRVADGTRARIFGTPRPDSGPGPVTGEPVASVDAAARPPTVPGSVRLYDALPAASGVTVAEHVLTPHARD